MGGNVSDLTSTSDAHDSTRARDDVQGTSTRAELSAHTRDTSRDLGATDNSDDWGIMKQLGEWCSMRKRTGADLYDDKREDGSSYNHNNNLLPSSKHQPTVNIRLDDGQTLLTAALRSNNITSVNSLLAHPGIDVNFPELKQYSLYSYIDVPPLLVAYQTGDSDLVKLLLDAGGSVNVQDSHGCTALYHCAGDGDYAMFSLLMNYSPSFTLDNDMNGPLHQACRAGHLQIVKDLIAAGCEVNPQMFSECTSPLELSLIQQHHDISIYLLDKGARASYGAEGTHAFLLACANGCAEVVDYFIQTGVNVNMVSEHNVSGLMLAMRGCDINRFGRELRVSGGDDMQQMINKVRKCLRESVTIALKMCTSGFDLEKKTIDKYCLSPLSISLYTCNIPVTLVLLKHGALWDDNCHSYFGKRNIKNLFYTDKALFETLIQFLDPKRRYQYLPEYYKNTTPSLKDSCRQTIRGRLKEGRTSGTSIQPLIRDLGLPKMLKDYLCYTDVDEYLLIDNMTTSFASLVT